MVRTNHYSLKYLLDYKIGTPLQQKWVSKLLGYDFVVKYKKSPNNGVIDALSHKEEMELSLALISVPSLEGLEEIKQGYGNEFDL